MDLNDNAQPSFAPSRVYKRRRFRKPISCQPCRHSKLRCDRQSPCGACQHRKRVAQCAYIEDETAAASIADALESGTPRPSLPSPMQAPESLHTIGSTSSSGPSPLAVSSCHDPADQQPQHHGDPTAASSDFPNFQWRSALQQPTEQLSHSCFESQDMFSQLGSLCFPFLISPRFSTNELTTMLPSLETCEYLISRYFSRISPFFHVLHGPTFQRQFRNFAKSPSSCDLSWLALLLVICSVTVNALDDEDYILKEIISSCSGCTPTTVAHRFRIMAMVCLCQDNFLTNHYMSTLESLLILIYAITHNEGVESSWVLLGMATNIGLALQCNKSYPPSALNVIDIERRRRCWAGILMLHTYQAMFRKDANMSSLVDDRAPRPAEVNDTDVLEDQILPPSTQPAQTSIIKFKISLFRLSARVCKELSDETPLDVARLGVLDAEICSEQAQWASAYLLDGEPNLLTPSSYAVWCGLELYAHQMYLLLHWPFSQAAIDKLYRPQSRQKCITASESLLEIHRKWVESPHLRDYRWYAQGIIGSCALHAMITLASCLLEQVNEGVDISTHRAVFNAAVLRLSKLKNNNELYQKAYPALQHLRNLLVPDQLTQGPEAYKDFSCGFDSWIDNSQWLNPESIDWTFWNDTLNSSTTEGHL